MRAMMVRTLLRLYPATWRQRYGAEIEDLLVLQSASPSIILDVMRGAIDARIHSQMPVLAPALPAPGDGLSVGTAGWRPPALLAGVLLIHIELYLRAMALFIPPLRRALREVSAEQPSRSLLLIPLLLRTPPRRTVAPAPHAHGGRWQSFLDPTPLLARAPRARGPMMRFLPPYEGGAAVARGLSKRFGPVRAVDDIGLAAFSGEIFGVLGPNGAGKTTTLRLLATILRPDAGTATVQGHDIRSDRMGVRRAVGMLSPSFGLYPRLTARENVAYVARLHGLSRAETDRRVAALFRLFDMEDDAGRRAATLSTGTRQKVAIARAVVHDPPVLIFDEPTSGLDVLTARVVVEFMRACRDQGTCVLLSTHQMAEAGALCDRIAIIDGGRVRALGPVAEILATTGTNTLEDAFVAVVGRAAAVDAPGRAATRA